METPSPFIRPRSFHLDKFFDQIDRERAAIFTVTGFLVLLIVYLTFFRNNKDSDGEKEIQWDPKNFLGI